MRKKFFESIIFMSRLFDINAQPTVLHRSFYNSLRDLPDDFSIDLYTYVIARRNKLKIGRFKTIFSERIFGKSTWNSGIKSVAEMIWATIKYSLKLRKKIANY